MSVIMHRLDVRPLDVSAKKAAQLACPDCGQTFVLASAGAVMRRFVAAVQAAHSC